MASENPGPTIEEIQANSRVVEIAGKLIEELARQSGDPAGGGQVEMDPELCLNALLFAAATLIEADPALVTNRHIRLAGENAGGTVADMVKLLRKSSQAEGKSYFEALGGKAEVKRVN